VGKLIKDLINKKNCMDGLELLGVLDNESVDACIFDPEYRQIMDKLKFGNEGKSRQVARSQLTQMSDETIIKFLKEIYRVLKPSSYLGIWTDKFIVAEGHHNTWFQDKYFDGIDLVDLINWKKGFGMGKRSRRTCEFLVIMQKLPKTTKNWTDKGIPDCFEEKIPNPRNKELHVHRKPIEFTTRLIRSIVPANGLVLDPAAGSFSTFDACKLAGVNFMGSEIEERFCK
jgi:site-specific DNA-methyltransferase (adenine-specific)